MSILTLQAKDFIILVITMQKKSFPIIRNARLDEILQTRGRGNKKWRWYGCCI